MTAPFPVGTRFDLLQLLASDELYFRLGSEVQSLSQGELVYAPGLTRVPAGCVVQSVHFQGSRADAFDWVDEAEEAVRATGAPLCRVYLQFSCPQLSTALEQRGYRPRQELALSADPLRLGIESKVRFHQVASERDWMERRKLHDGAPDNSDGYPVDPASWCELIRRKCETGWKESFLIEYQGRVCGSIGAIQMADVLRLKNILIGADFRRLGLGLEAVRELAALTHRRGLAALTVFGIEGEPGAALYQRAGFSVAGWQTEWSKCLHQR